MDAVPRKKARLETARKSSEALNTAADEAAGGCMARLRNSSRLEWANRVQNNTEWKVKAMEAAATIATAYHDFLKTKSTRPRESAFVSGGA